MFQQVDWPAGRLAGFWCACGEKTSSSGARGREGGRERGIWPDTKEIGGHKVGLKIWPDDRASNSSERSGKASELIT